METLNQTNKNNPEIKGFDSQNPPAQNLIDACVHCGFCLSTCPSYRVLGKEMDSPRGRIYLMDAINNNNASLNETSAQHFDSCLGCLACTTACPSGVQYDKLITATRPQVERNQPRSLTDNIIRQIIFNLFPYPNRLSFFLPALFLYQKSGLQKLIRQTKLLAKVSPRLSAMESVLPKIQLKSKTNFPDIIPAQGEKRYRVGMILGCVQQLFFDPVNTATARVLSANGCEIVIPKNQGCCAALPSHQGQEKQAQILAKEMIDKFAHTEVDYIIINAAGCGHTLKEYGHILADDREYAEKAKAFSQKVKDVNEFLMEIGLTAELSPLTKEEKLTIVYQDACHLLHGQKISLQPRQLLRKIPNVQLKEPIDASLCCGSAGVYNLLQPAIADELGQQKVENLLNTQAQLIASPNPGCALQIQKHLALKGKTIMVKHPIELLDYSLRGISLDQLQDS